MVSWERGLPNTWSRDFLPGAIELIIKYPKIKCLNILVKENIELGDRIFKIILK